MGYSEFLCKLIKSNTSEYTTFEESCVTADSSLSYCCCNNHQQPNLPLSHSPISRGAGPIQRGKRTPAKKPWSREQTRHKLMRSQDLLKTPEHAFHSHSGYCMLYTRTILLPVVEGVISHVMLTHHRIDMNTAGLWLALCRCQTPVLPMPQFRLPGHWAILRHTKAALATLKKWIQARYLCQFAFEAQVSNKKSIPYQSQWIPMAETF